MSPGEAGSDKSRRMLEAEVLGPFRSEGFEFEVTRDGIPTWRVPAERILPLLRYLKEEAEWPYPMLFDLTAVDERARRIPPPADYTVVYHLLCFARNAQVRLKVPLEGDRPSLPSAVPVFPSANWYEREVWDMFGIRFQGHPGLRRILMSPTWHGHPLRKDHPARATEMGPFTLTEEKEDKELEALRFDPSLWGLTRASGDAEFIFLNVGPQHPGTHGVLRIVLQLDGEVILDAVPDIGFHHRGAEKMSERQSWHTYIPYTDRVDYLAGVLNNMAYLQSVEKLAGIDVPDRAQVIRVMLCELFRISSHLVWFGTFAQDVGALSPVFYMFTDRERLLRIIEAICGGRLHPNWFRIGGVAADLPQGWDSLVRNFVDYLPARLREYESMVMRNRIFQARTKGVGQYTKAEAVEWGVTGPNLRCTGFGWDFRKARPYGGYDRFDFEVPVAQAGDCYARAQVRVAEMWQSLRIIRQCLENMPEGPYKSAHPLATPPRKERTMHDIETLIDHFLGVSWGPVLPEGEASVITESSKGAYSYYIVSDKDIHSYRTRIRAPSFAHMQQLPLITRDRMVPDLLAVLGAMDFVLADVDR